METTDKQLEPLNPETFLKSKGFRPESTVFLALIEGIFRMPGYDGLSSLMNEYAKQKVDTLIEEILGTGLVSELKVHEDMSLSDLDIPDEF